MSGGPTIEGATPLKGLGFLEVPLEPAWTGTIVGGESFQLFATSGDTRTELDSGGARKILLGRALYCRLVLPNDSPLSFFRATPRKPRYFVAGFAPCPWPDSYDERYNEGNSFFSTGCLSLQANPLLRVIYGANCGVEHGAWLVDEGECPDSIRTCPFACSEARRFLSFLVGRSLPFLWTDRFAAEGHLTRLYFGMPHGYGTIAGNEQPVPLCQLSDVIKHSQEVCARLPAMFERFRKIAKDYDLDFISSPIWIAFDTYADDKLTFACVSLERLATAHDEFLKRNPALAPQTQEFLSSEQSSALKPVLGSVVKALADPLKISADAVRILVDKKINNILTPPNADKLSEVFAFLGLELSADEKKSIDHRNRTLHGRRTMKESSLQAVAEETKRFDVLRTLINKAVLRLLEYDGPYVDWGTHVEKKGLSIKVLPTRTVSATSDS